METHAAGFTPPIPLPGGDISLPSIGKKAFSQPPVSRSFFKEEDPNHFPASDVIARSKFSIPSFAAPPSRQREMEAFAVATTPRIEDAQKLVPSLQNIKLAPINRKNFLDGRGLPSRQQRQSFMIGTQNFSLHSQYISFHL